MFESESDDEEEDKEESEDEEEGEGAMETSEPNQPAAPAPIVNQLVDMDMDMESSDEEGDEANMPPPQPLKQHNMGAPPKDMIIRKDYNPKAKQDNVAGVSSMSLWVCVGLLLLEAKNSRR